MVMDLNFELCAEINPTAKLLVARVFYHSHWSETRVPGMIYNIDTRKLVIASFESDTK